MTALRENVNNYEPSYLKAVTNGYIPPLKKTLLKTCLLVAFYENDISYCTFYALSKYSNENIKFSIFRELYKYAIYFFAFYSKKS